MSVLFRYLIVMILTVIALPASAHDVRVMKLRFEELADVRYQIRYVAPPGSPESQSVPILPARGAWEQEPGVPSGMVKLLFTTVDSQPLLEDDTIRLPWASDGIIIESFWRNGETSRRFFRAEAHGVIVRVGDMRAGTGSMSEGAKRYTFLGAEHILTGWDHLLFICCLLMLVRGWKQVVMAITAFTLAHSLMLACATFGWAPVNGLLVEALIALSIAFLAAEVLRPHRATFLRRPLTAAFGFGLLHGMGLAGALRDLSLPPAEVPLALGFFNVGVELGQLAFILPLLMLAWAWRRLALSGGERIVRAAAWAAGAIAMFWFFDRTLGILA